MCINSLNFIKTPKICFRPFWGLPRPYWSDIFFSKNQAASHNRLRTTYQIKNKSNENSEIHGTISKRQETCSQLKQLWISAIPRKVLKNIGDKTCYRNSYKDIKPTCKKTTQTFEPFWRYSTFKNWIIWFTECLVPDAGFADH